MEKYGFDELYENIFRRPIDQLSHGVQHWIEDKALLMMVDGTGSAAKGLGHWMKGWHNGQILTYLIAIVVGLIAILYFI